jgi:hypothetical protein
MAEEERAGRAPLRAPHPSSRRSGRQTFASDGKASPERAAPLVDQRAMFYCDVCAHSADATWKRDRYGEWRWHVGNAFTLRCPKGGDCLRTIAEALGTTAPKLKDDPLSYLGPWLTSGGEREEAAGHLAISVDAVDVRRWHCDLLTTEHALSYLTITRGLSRDIIIAAKVGFDQVPGVLTFPAFDASGRPSYLYRRRPVAGAKMIACGGPRQPYPDMPPQGALCLVAGELDALTARQMGLRAVTVSGCSLPAHALPKFTGRVVYILFDVGEESAAHDVAQKLRGVASAVQVVDWPAGLPEKTDLNDWVMHHGGTTDALRQLLRPARRTIR